MRTRREVLGSLAGAAAGPLFTPQVQESARLKARDRLRPFNYEGVRLLDGRLRDQVVFARDFFASIPDDNLLVGFRKRAGLPAPGTPLEGWYGGDVFNAFGQYLSGMARLSKGLGDPAIGAKAHRLMTEWAKTIEPDGYFYYSRKPITPHYIYEKTVCGLVDLYEYGGHEDATAPLERITDWAVKNLDRARKKPLTGGATYDGNGEWYTIPENVYRAFELTGNAKYRDFAAVWHYPDYWGMFTRESEPDPFGFHAYSHVNTLSSAAMAYAVNGDSQYLRTIVNAFDWLERTQMYATGGFGPTEKLQRPDGSLGRSLEDSPLTFETVCGSWAGFKLGRYLLRFTGEARYGDWMEKLLYNGIGAALNMKADGSNFYYSDYTLGGGRKGFHPVKWACCSGTYPQALADYHNIIYFHAADSLFVNLYVPSEVTWKWDGAEVRVEQSTKYPEEETSHLSVSLARPARFKLQFRVPRWCRGATAEINGKRQTIAADPGTWAALDRTWENADRVRITIPMRVAAVPVDTQHLNRVAFVYGPVVLVRDDKPVIAAGSGDVAGLLVKRGNGLEFEVRNQRWGPFVPFYRLGFGEGYHMYFDVAALSGRSE